jgi:effector-binding domain-containing protein
MVTLTIREFLPDLSLNLTLDNHEACRPMAIMDSRPNLANLPPMIEPPHIVQTVGRPTAIIHITVPQEEIQEVMGPALQELRGAIADQGITPAGPWFTHHLRRPSGSFDFEVSVPVERPVRPTGRIQPSVWPEMKVARTIYHGAYEGLGDAWSEFIDWMEANGLESTQDLWEVYAVGPESSEDPADWQTELNQPLIG